MIDKALAGLNPQGGESYYFQLYPLNLSIIGKDSEVPAPGTTYRFTILKGQQKFDQNKLAIDANFKKVNGVNVMIIPKCPLNFYIPSFNKNRKVQFTFKLFQTQNSQEYDIGEFLINIQPYVTEFKETRNVRFQHKSYFSEDYELQFQIYVEKSRFALEKVVKDYKVERGLKSPLKERKEGSVNSSSKRGTTSPPAFARRNEVNQAPSKDESQRHDSALNEKERDELTELQSNNRDAASSRQSKKEGSVYSGSSRISGRALEKKQESKIVNAASSEIKVDGRQLKKVDSVIKTQIKNQNVESKPESEDKIGDIIEYQTIENKDIAEPIINYNERSVKGSQIRSGKCSQIRSEHASQKNEKQMSELSKKVVPLIQTSLRQLAKFDTPAQVRMTESQRLGSTTVQNTQTGSSSNKSNTKQLVALWVFLLMSAFLMYVAMHPNKRV